ncbi:MAG: ATP cone domain-containing protein, partial [Candidatus Dojkabacteria bacterium]
MVTRIQKTSGESEEFNPEKIRSSLVAAGAEESIATTLTAEIASHPEDFPSTDRIHQRLFERLKQENKRPLAARYNLRRAIIELGPSGYPFEKFTAALLSARGMQTQLNLTMQGECVSH